MEIHRVENNYVISSHGYWLPGSYESAAAAIYAFRFTDEILQALQDTVNPGGVITFEMLKKLTNNARRNQRYNQRKENITMQKIINTLQSRKFLALIAALATTWLAVYNGTMLPAHAVVVSVVALVGYIWGVGLENISTSPIVIELIKALVEKAPSPLPPDRTMTDDELAEFIRHNTPGK